MTDVPCFSLIKNNGGVPLGVMASPKSAKQTFQALMATDRVKGLYSPDYTEERDLGSILRLSVGHIAQRIEIQREAALR